MRVGSRKEGLICREMYVEKGDKRAKAGNKRER